MNKKKNFKIGDIVKVRQTSSIGEVVGIYSIGKKEMLIFKTKTGQNIKISSESCIIYK